MPNPGAAGVLTGLGLSPDMTPGPPSDTPRSPIRLREGSCQAQHCRAVVGRRLESGKPSLQKHGVEVCGSQGKQEGAEQQLASC